MRDEGGSRIAGFKPWSEDLSLRPSEPGDPDAGPQWEMITGNGKKPKKGVPS